MSVNPRLETTYQSWFVYLGKPKNKIIACFMNSFTFNVAIKVFQEIFYGFIFYCCIVCPRNWEMAFINHFGFFDNKGPEFF